MKLLQKSWIALLELFDVLTFSSIAPKIPSQQALQQANSGSPALQLTGIPHAPRFKPPSSRDDSIFCEYPSLGNSWKPCSTPHNRGCWLKKDSGEEYNINTDYENLYPKGITRKYYIEVDNKTIDADGVPNPWGKVFNHTYPGPWIQACWGDEVEITVKNKLLFNGTSIHWHGIRMNGTVEMDGVNAVTQCPIATNDYYTYKFRAVQYGTSWYHSHYSLQYGDGMAGPLTIHGPSSSDYDIPVDPILMTDWNHRSGFMDFQSEIDGTGPPKMDSILLNGIGSYAAIAKGGLKYKLKFHKGARYLLRLINTSVDTTFIFSIDSHNLTVMSSDFVPIHSYTTDHVVIGIGQRYHIVVSATPRDRHGKFEEKPTQYWIRTIPANSCSFFLRGGVPDERQGILDYQNLERPIPRTERSDFSLDCRDEPYEKLRPILPWKVPKVDISENQRPFSIGIDNPGPPDGRPLPTDNFTRWAIGERPMFLNFSDPTIFNLNRKKWDPDFLVISKDGSERDWAYLIITANDTTPKDIGRRHFLPAAHPMHLHGHDFALLQQSTEPYSKSVLNLTFDNPPRRDVVLLPINGFVIIAFKLDNPGTWLLHCHIAWHASSGLALQILENQAKLKKSMTPGRLKEVERGCRNWDLWFSDHSNFWHPDGGALGFQDDSGI